MEYRFTYIDTKQTMDILDNNSIKISGGQVKVEIFFRWNKTEITSTPSKPLLGIAVATTISSFISFVKQLRI